MPTKSTRKPKRKSSGGASIKSARTNDQRRSSLESARSRKRPRPPLPEQSQPSPGLEADVSPRPQYSAPDYRPAGKLADRVAVVTGGDSGIGRAVAVMFAREGADVAIVYLPEEERDAAETRAHIERSGRRALLIAGDVMQSEFCRTAVDRVVRELGSIDILVNNAAFQQNVESIDELTEGRDPRVHEIAGAESRGAGHSRELCGTGTGVDAAERRSPEARGRIGVRGGHTDGTSGAARGDRAGVRVFRLECRFELRHRRGPDVARRRDYRRLGTRGVMRKVSDGGAVIGHRFSSGAKVPLRDFRRGP